VADDVEREVDARLAQPHRGGEERALVLHRPQVADVQQPRRA